MATRERRGIFSIMLFTLLLFNIAATTLFVHSHIIDGKTIVHSHPFGGAATAHSHTKGYLQLINDIANSEAITPQELLSNDSLALSFITSYTVCNTPLTEPSLAIVSLRAPPVMA